jgi:hypothetical protein
MRHKHIQACIRRPSRDLHAAPERMVIKAETISLTELREGGQPDLAGDPSKLEDVFAQLPSHRFAFPRHLQAIPILTNRM